MPPLLLLFHQHQQELSLGLNVHKPLPVTIRHYIVSATNLAGILPPQSLPTFVANCVRRTAHDLILMASASDAGALHLTTTVESLVARPMVGIQDTLPLPQPANSSRKTQTNTNKPFGILKRI
ncbi:hypothetical protein EAE96_010540 [Botrytis aclada]|nr:hypothetical protein EAE96_010540 [Botrytis aclada]